MEVKGEFDDTIKVLTRDWGNIFSANSWKLLFCKNTLMM